jgi:glycerate-2-kinase
VSSGGAIRGRLESIFRHALAAVEPGVAVRRRIALEAGGELSVAGTRLSPDARLVVPAAGKAAGPMARALEEVAGDRIAAGLAVGPVGAGAALERIETLEASHPLPDARSEVAGRAALRLVSQARPGDLLLVLLSGGASSLLAVPASGLRTEDLRATTRLLLGSGAPIHEQNAVRKHLSALAGGQLALRATADRIEVLLLSDVPGDRIDVIGSGPCAPDPTTYADAVATLERRGLRDRIPDPVWRHLEAGRRGERTETPDAREPRLRRVRHHVLASNRTARDAAALAAARDGLRPVCLTPPLTGEARIVGRRLAALARATAAPQPLCVVAGGETVVTLRGSGRGGRNQELALAAAIELEGSRGTALLAAGTDGRDGPTDAAGAFVDGGSTARGGALGLDARAALEDNDSYGFFAAEGGLLRTGPTRTNVMDLVLAYAASPNAPRRG